jgi:hypothetical protein
MSVKLPLQCDNCGGNAIVPVVSGKEPEHYHLSAQGRVAIGHWTRFGGLTRPLWRCRDCSEFLGQPDHWDEDELGLYRAAVERVIAGYVRCSEAEFKRHVRKTLFFELLDEIAPLAATSFRVHLSATGAIVSTDSGEAVAKRASDEDVSEIYLNDCRLTPVILLHRYRWFCRASRLQDGRGLIELEREVINPAYSPKWT